MYGNSNGRTNGDVVGFNIESAVKLCGEIGASYTSCKKTLSKIITNIGYMVFDPEAGGYSSDYGWFSDEAVTFYKQEFEEVSKSLVGNLSRTYDEYYIQVQNAIGKWVTTTGVREVPNVGMIHESPIGIEWKSGMFLDYPVKNRDKNGNIRISRTLGTALNNYKSVIRTELEAACNEAIRILSKSAIDSFFGMGQQQALIDRVKRTMGNIENETIMLTSSIIAEVNNAIEQYTNIAQQVAASFGGSLGGSPTSSTVGSISNSFNTIK